jgi:hypothetical protein
MALGKILLIMVTMNLFLYLAGVQLFDNDIFDRFVDVSDNGDRVDGYSTFGDNLPNDPQGSVGGIGADNDSFSFFDALGLIIDVVKFLMNIVFAPVAVFVGTGMPFILQLLVGVPLGILYIFGLIVLIRGGGA